MKEYIEAAKPMFSIGEYWDSCNYNGHDLDYNQGNMMMHYVDKLKSCFQVSGFLVFLNGLVCE